MSSKFRSLPLHASKSNLGPSSIRKQKQVQIRRLYHSYEHPPSPGPFSAIETSILSASIPHIPSHGFTNTALSLGAKDSGYLDASTNLFPRGAFSLVHYHLYTQRTGLMQKKQALDDEIRESSGVDGKGMKLGTGAMVKRLTWERLMGNKEIIHRWQEALALIAQPANVPISITELSLLADEIWFLANDTSVDSSWYTKRTSLSTIYAATELFMTTDKSVDFADTREFLERRFKDVQVLGGAVGDFGEWAGYTARAAVNVLRSKGVRI